MPSIQVLYAALEQGTSLAEAPVALGRASRLFYLAVAALLLLTGWILFETGVLDAELGARGNPSGVSIFIAPPLPRGGTGAFADTSAVPLFQYVGYGCALCVAALLFRRSFPKKGQLGAAALFAGLCAALLFPLLFASEFRPGVCAANASIYQCQTVRSSSYV